jgi:hypothetical protein
VEVNCDCFLREHLHGGPVSLNRSEQRLLDYVEKHPDERQYWMHKVRADAAGCTNDHEAASLLEPELWRYYVERSSVVPVFVEAARRDGLRRTSMRNLAEYLLRIWAPSRTKRPAEGDPHSGHRKTD